MDYNTCIACRLVLLHIAGKKLNQALISVLMANEIVALGNEIQLSQCKIANVLLVKVSTLRLNIEFGLILSIVNY